VPLAGVGAWFAAGAATRSVLLRAWAAFVWALTPALLLGVGQGRLGAVLAHLALPWVALGVARAVGVNRVDTIVSGMVGAQRVGPVDLAPERPSADQVAAAAALAEHAPEADHPHAPHAPHAPRVRDALDALETPGAPAAATAAPTGASAPGR